MKRILLSLLVLFFVFQSSAGLEIEKLEPAFWWTGMKNTELQIMVYGKDFTKVEVEVLSPEVKLTRFVIGDSPDYLFLYLDIRDAKPGFIKLQFKEGKKSRVLSYELKVRNLSSKDRQGFSTEDVLYLLMPDRFANGDVSNDGEVDRANPNARHGGDFAGIEKNLDYIAGLGVTAIWLNPVLENKMEGGSYHGYASTDYYKTDYRFGTNSQYKSLIDKAHSKGLKVVMDMIFNHCGNEHVWVNNRPFKDWINYDGKFVQTNHSKFVSFDPYASEYDSKLMFDGWFVETMPDLNQRNEHLAKYLIQNSIWWIEYSGIDGIRQDTHPYADSKMMSEWCKAVYDEYPGFSIVGEAWINYQPGIVYWQKGNDINKGLDSNLKTVMDFPLMLESHNAFHKETDWDNGLTRIYEHLSFDFMFPDVNNLLVFLENHDTNRFLLEYPTNLDIFKQAYTFLFTTRGIPQIYYGCEILMSGNKKISDGDIRLDFPGGWPGDKVNAFSVQGRNSLQNEAYSFISKILNWRKGNLAVSKGSLKHFVPRNGAYVYFRQYQNQKVLVILNGTCKENTISTQQYREVLKDISQGKDILTGKTVVFNDSIRLGARETLILEL